MKQILPAAENIAKCKVLSEGQLDISVALQKLSELGDEHIRIESMPNKTLSVKWSEVHSPRIKRDFAEGLAADRLYSKNFQFFGVFLAEGNVVAAQDWQNKYADKTNDEATTQAAKSFAEVFTTKGTAGYLLYEKFATQSAFNCTWLLEFLIAPQDCLQGDEYFIAKAQDGAYVIELQANNGRYREIERYIFKGDFTALTWEHHTLLD